MKAELNSHMAGGQVGNHHRDEEGTDTGRALGKELLILAVHGLYATDTSADVSTDTVTVFLLQVNLGIFDSQLGSGHSELGIAVHALGFLLVDESSRIEILHLAGNLGAILGSVETGNLLNAVLALQQVLPEFILANTHRGNCPQAGDNYAIAQNNISSRNLLPVQ